MTDNVLGTSFVQTLTAIKSKVDLFLKEASNDQEGAVSLSNVAGEKGREVLQRLERALDDLSELQQTSKVCIAMKLDGSIISDHYFACNFGDYSAMPNHAHSIVNHQ